MGKQVTIKKEELTARLTQGRHQYECGSVDVWKCGSVKVWVKNYLVMKMKNWVLIARYVLGFIYLVFGLDYFFHFIPYQPLHTGKPGDWLRGSRARDIFTR